MHHPILGLTEINIYLRKPGSYVLDRLDRVDRVDRVDREQDKARRSSSVAGCRWRMGLTILILLRLDWLQQTSA